MSLLFPLSSFLFLLYRYMCTSLRYQNLFTLSIVHAAFVYVLSSLIVIMCIVVVLKKISFFFFFRLFFSSFFLFFFSSFLSSSYYYIRSNYYYFTEIIYLFTILLRTMAKRRWYDGRLLGKSYASCSSPLSSIWLTSQARTR